MAKKNVYDNESISSLKGADRVRKRPGVIFGSDGLEGCEHAVFEILSNAIDEARGGYGRLITVTRFLDRSVQVEDMGRGCPVDWNEKEGRYNWELVFCELYAGGKYDNENSENYEFSLGLNGLGSCATQYASRYMDVTVYREGKEYRLHFERGEIVGKLESTELTTNKKRTGTTIRWLPDLEVFTDIAVPLDYYQDVMKRQAVVNAGVTFRLRNETAPGKFDTQEFLYENGIADYIRELAGDDALTEPVFWEAERRGRDRADKPEYKVKLSVALCFSNRTAVCEYYHNSSYLEHGGSPEKATRSAMVSAIDKYLRDNNKYTKGESKITFPDVQDCLILVSNSFSTQTSYENQTKKAITNKFVQEAMTEFLRSRMEIYFIENKEAAEKIAAQVLINKRSRETAERTRINQKKKLTEKIDIANRVQKFVDCRTKDVDRREIYIVEGDSALGACKQSRDAEFQGLMPVRGKILNCLKADYPRIFKSDVITDLMKVLGCGVDICYPEENRPLYEKLKESGCILSEYPPGTLPHSRLFPPRNRIISALSNLVLVIEAREKSGTLITVDMALEQGKDVFAVPGRITDTCSRGCNRLIGNGAGIAVSVAQLLQELQGSVPHAGRDETFSLAQAERPNAAKAADVIADKMLCPVTDALSSTASSSWPPLRKTIWQALDTMPQSMDEIADTLVRQKISINVQMLMQELVFLELEGAAGSVMGRYYRKTFACNDG